MKRLTKRNGGHSPVDTDDSVVRSLTAMGRLHLSLHLSLDFNLHLSLHPVVTLLP